MATLNDGSISSAYFNFTDGNSTLLKLSIGLVIAFGTYAYYFIRRHESGGIYHLPDNIISTTRAFYTKRVDFLASHFRKSDFFQFRVLNHKVVAVSGDEARKIFFTDRYLSFLQGYTILSGRAPSLKDIDVKKEITELEQLSFINKTLMKIFYKERLRDLIPILLKDINKITDTWGKSGRIDPMAVIYKTVFQMMSRLVTCRAIADDKVAVERLTHLFATLLDTSTRMDVILPWFPGRHYKRVRRQATAELYGILATQVSARKKETANSDALDVLVAEGLDTTEIISWVMTTLSAGVMNTSNMPSWTLIELDVNPEWKRRCQKEARDLIIKHVGPNASDLPVHEQIASLPMDALEEEMPILDACVREAMRVHFTLTALRRNITDDLRVGDKVIEKGAFIAYNVTDANLDSRIYPQPETFDPDRFLVRHEDSKSQKPHPYVVWGAGRNACPGMRVAKLQMKLLLTQILLSFNYKLVDENGKFPNPLPRPDHDVVHFPRTFGKPCYLQYERIAA